MPTQFGPMSLLPWSRAMSSSSCSPTGRGRRLAVAGREDSDRGIPLTAHSRTAPATRQPRHGDEREVRNARQVGYPGIGGQAEQVPPPGLTG